MQSIGPVYGEPMSITDNNRDNGSLDTGAVQPRVGDEVWIVGEATPRRVTYVMGSVRNGWHACFRGQGAVPTGRVEWELHPADPRGLASLDGEDVTIHEDLAPRGLPSKPKRKSEGETTAAAPRSYERCDPLLRPAPFLTPATVVAHADWSGCADAKERIAKRQQVRADRVGGRYHVQAPSDVPDPGAWLGGLVAEAREGAAVVVGFDFVIGIPDRYAALVRTESFLDFVVSAPPEFFEINTDPDNVSPRCPFFPKNEGCWAAVQAPKGQKVQAIAHKIGLTDVRDLLRRCEHATEERAAGAPLFITSSSKQVGRAAIYGWLDVIRPALEEHHDVVRIWPYHGPLEDLVRPGTLTIVETYPAETYAHLGIGPPSAKRDQVWRRDATRRMLDVVDDTLLLAPALELAAEDGFGPGTEGEDPFDALVGALGIIMVMAGRDSAPVPSSDPIRKIEGWILGLAPQL